MRVNLQKSNYYDSLQRFIATQTPKTVWCAEQEREDAFKQRLISTGLDNAQMWNTRVAHLFSPEPGQQSRLTNLPSQTDSVFLTVLVKDMFGFTY